MEDPSRRRWSSKIPLGRWSSSKISLRWWRREGTNGGVARGGRQAGVRELGPGFAPRRPRNRAREHARTEPWPTRAGAPPGRRPRRPGTASAGGTTTAGRREGRTRRGGDGGGNQEEGGGVGAELRVGFGRAASRRERRRRLPIGRRVGFGGSAGEQRLGAVWARSTCTRPKLGLFWPLDSRNQNSEWVCVSKKF